MPITADTIAASLSSVGASFTNARSIGRRLLANLLVRLLKLGQVLVGLFLDVDQVIARRFDRPDEFV